MRKKIKTYVQYINEGNDITESKFEFKIGDKVRFDGYDGNVSIDTICDIWYSKPNDGFVVELEQNEITLTPSQQKELNFQLYTN